MSDNEDEYMNNDMLGVKLGPYSNYSDRGDDDLEMQDDDYSPISTSANVQEAILGEDELKEFFEPVDPTKEGVYIVRQFDENTAKARWKLDQLSKTRISSNIFEIGGYQWSILCFPRGNNVSQLSIYLACEGETSPSWSRFARFQLSIINQKDITKTVSQEAEKRFNQNETDWGFREFHAHSVLLDEENGFLSPIDASLTIECVIHVVHEAHLLNPHNYNSKTETGHVGLKNQGATCYMNSLLQTLYNIAYFRRAVYKMPIEESEEPSSSIPLALQRVFWRLQYEPDSVDTKELTKSFGWDTIDSFLQHDVQELCRVLCDNLEMKMENTNVKGTMKYLLEGTCKNYIRCLNVDYESSRKESFYDLQLNVKNCNDVYKSFDQYVEEETLEGDNKYQAEGFGYQDAKKGCIFLSLPPVLMLHLKRFEYDIQKDAMNKINDRYEFPLELNLEKYLADDSEQKNGDNTYVLFSVLVHSGDLSGGHYYAFMKPIAGSDQWYKFDDERVYKVKEHDAVEENYGGTADEKKNKYFWLNSTGHNMYKKFTNAYMLLYIRKADTNEILQKVEDHDVPDHLQTRFKQEREDKERRKQEKAEAWKYTSFKFIHDEMLHKQFEQGPDLIKIDRIQPVRILKQSTFADLKSICEQQFNIPARNIRLWTYSKRINKTYRVHSPVKHSDKTTLDRIWNFNNVDNVTLYIENKIPPSSDSSTLPPIEKGDCIVFFKFYDPTNVELIYVGSEIVKNNMIFENVIPLFEQLIRSSPSLINNAEQDSNEYDIYEEIKPTIIESKSLQTSLKSSDVGHGDVYIFQKKISNPQDYKYPTVKDYFDYLSQRATIKLYEFNDPKGDSIQCIELELLKNQKYQQIVEQIATVLNVDWKLLRLTGHGTTENQPREVAFKSTETKSLKDLLSTPYGQISTILYYQVLDVPLVEIENKKELVVHVYGSDVQLIRECKLLMDKKSTIGDLKKNVIEKMQSEHSIALSNDLRVMEVSNHRIYLVYDDAFNVNKIQDATYEIRVEEIPKDELLAAHQKHKRIMVAHFCKERDGVRLFGNPFFIYVNGSETVRNVKDFIQSKLNVKDEEFKRFKLACISGLLKRDYLNDDDLFLEQFIKESGTSHRVELYLGLEHKDPNPRTSSNRWYDKPIVIKN
ncbi:ubiquitin carboxyl-terminal hydrolase [Acrasis kona]|uniref:ubiquitinyl hydrolase 1 n=1 Tax=Acrasis kona TaxID=1008807 RepID=A0AAW2Z801_9EUKA